MLPTAARARSPHRLGCTRDQLHVAANIETATPLRGAFRVFRSMGPRWMDNDVYGHINNVVYYSYFDTAVNGWLLDATGTDIRALPAIGVVAETSCRFLKSISFPENLHQGLRCERLVRRSVVYGLGVFKGEEQDPAAIGRFVHVYVDAQNRRPVDVPKAIRAAVQRYLV
jgi:acyl-CoA thioester hydrolase